METVKSSERKSENKIHVPTSVFPSHSYNATMDEAHKSKFERMIKSAFSVNEEFVNKTRANYYYFPNHESKVVPQYQKWIDQCSYSQVVVDVKHYTHQSNPTKNTNTKTVALNLNLNSNLDIEIIRPKSSLMLNEKNNEKNLIQPVLRKALIHFHGGGAVMMRARDDSPVVSRMAVEGDMVVFNVDYRLSPESKMPAHFDDAYAALMYVREHAEELQVDKDRIAVHGLSGGAFVVAGLAYMLASRQEGHLCKFVHAHVPMTGHQLFTQPEHQMNLVEQACWKSIRNNFTMICPEGQKVEDHYEDPWMFANEMSDAEMLNLPPFVVTTTEFDFLRVCATQLATKLQRVGKLLDWYIVPGEYHETLADLSDEGSEKVWTAYNLIYTNYL